MNTTVSVSIIIPVYNSENIVSRCIESILANTYHDYEIILINDGSSDGSLSVLEAYREKFPGKIRVFSQENQGVAKTRNNGIRYATSKYIMFIDHDDFVEPDYLERFASAIEKNDLDVVIGGYRRSDGQKVLYEMKLKDAPWSRYMIMAPWSKIYKREFILANGIEFLSNNIGEDVYFNLQVIHLTTKLSFLDYCGYNWFYNERSVSNTSQKTLKNEIHVLFLLNRSYDRLKQIGVIGRDDVEFYFIRYVVWYLLFSGRNSGYGRIMAEFTKTFDWLRQHFPGFEKNKNISLFRPNGETARNRVFVYFFMMLWRLKLHTIFFRMYARGKEN